MTAVPRPAHWLHSLLLALLLVFAGPGRGQPPPPADRPAEPAVLLLLSTGYGQAGIDSYVKGFYEVLREQGLRLDRIHVEYLDLVKNPGPAYRRELIAMLMAKYRGASLGAIVTMQPLALEFLLSEGTDIGPGAPVLVAQARPPRDGHAASRQLHFQTPTLAFAGTLQRALELFPRTEQVFVLSGNSAVEQERLQDARKQFQPWGDRIRFAYLDGKPFDEIERLLAQAPPHSIVIAPGVNRDGAGQIMVPVDSIVRIARTATAPVFPVYAGSMGQGPLGGMVSMLESEGQSMANSVLELLRRAPGDTGSFAVKTAKPVPLFDWREIERWNADWSHLPADTVYLHRPASLWGQYKGYVLGASGALTVLTALVFALTVQNRSRRRAERSLRASQSRYQLLADNMSDVLWVLNLQRGGWEYVSPSIRTLLGYSADEFMTMRLGDVMDAPLQSSFVHSNESRVRAYLSQPDESRSYTDILELRGRSGGTVWTESVTHYTRNEAGEPVLLGVTRDISQRMRAQAEINRLAFYDALTRLPNRTLLQDRIRHALVASSRSLHHGALLFIDLDHFKTLNDTRGHELGDQLLQQVAERLTPCVRASDTVARLGGDEFVVLLEDLDAEQTRAASDAKAIGDKVQAALEPAFMLGGQEHHATASIGITVFVGDGDTGDELLKRADLAMYRAKAAGRDGLCFFDPEMQAVVSARAALEADLRRALQAAEFVLHYQPQVDAEAVIVGAEALVRWNRPGGGLQSPATFIPLAEETGLIRPLGLWVLQMACRQLVQWADDAAMRGLSLAVNVSPRQFKHADFVATVLAALTDSGADPTLLKLELTESLMLDDIEVTIAKMHELRRHGVSFSLDDFGTGYSSLAYLKRLPLAQLKIDRSFVRDVLTDANDASIAGTVLALGHSLGLNVIAEGVETEGQHAFLADLGCDGFQGYLFSQPLPADAFKTLCSRQQR